VLDPEHTEAASTPILGWSRGHMPCAAGEPALGIYARIRMDGIKKAGSIIKEKHQEWTVRSDQKGVR